MNNKLIKRNLENQTHWWWLRSANSDDSNSVGCVGLDGNVDSYIAYIDIGVAAVCLII